VENVLIINLNHFHNYSLTLSATQSVFGTLSQELQTESQIALNLSVVPIKLISSLSFSHFAEQIKISDPLKRSFYEIECIKGTWGVRELRRQINSLFFERTGLGSNPEKLRICFKYQNKFFEKI